jgi:hypothetical protein
LQAFRQLDRIVISPEMDEKETRLLVEHMAVDGRRLDAVLAQGGSSDLSKWDAASRAVAFL